jgi:hypothetical protein
MFSLHGETADLCKRARDNGGAVWLQPVAEGVQFAAARAASPIDDQIARARASAHFARKYARTDFARHAVTVWGPLLVAFNAAKGAAMAPFKSLRKDTVLKG